MRTLRVRFVRDQRPGLRLAAPNRKELLVSIALAAATLFFASVPLSYGTALILAALMALAFVCAFNAILDLDAMGVVEAYLAVLWFIALGILVALALYGVGSIHEFSNR